MLLTHLKNILIIFVTILFIQPVFSQYTLNGTATKDNCHCYTLTPEDYYKNGSVWNNNKINLNQSFAFTFNIFLGCNDSPGADGIAFVLQPISTSIGSTGSGLGYQGVSPAVGVTLDTYQNREDNDPLFDHIAIQINGDLNHNTSNNLAGPVPISAVSDNVEDCKWHILKIIWDANTKKYEVYVDASLRVSIIKDFVADVFKGDPSVFWGFSGATGAEINLQKFCTTLDPIFKVPGNQIKCVGEKVSFYDSSLSFGAIAKRYWDFGDGSEIDSININPNHRYVIGGNYKVKLKLIGADGCTEVSEQNISVGNRPVAKFNISNTCANNSINLLDSSYVLNDKITNWFWDLGNASSSNYQNPNVVYTSEGIKTISLVIRSSQGCQSDTIYKSFLISNKPKINFQYLDSCKYFNVNFIGNNVNGVNISEWNWSFGDGTTSKMQNPQHTFLNRNNYQVQLYALAPSGCSSDTIKKNININGTQANAGNDIKAMVGQPIQLNGSGGVLYEWQPPEGLNNPFISNPIAVLYKDQTYILKAFTLQGCETYDTLKIKIYKGPDIYVPNAFTPNGDGLNDIFNIVTIGISQFYYFKVYNRFGQEIFSTTNNNKGWDGKFKNKDQPIGAYSWISSGIDLNRNILSKKGIVFLIR
jgi:gliding motility-associated-like protein